MVQAVPKDVLEKNFLPQIPIGRLGEASEIARCVVFLAADEAGLITASTLSANGGQYLPRRYADAGRTAAAKTARCLRPELRQLPSRP